MDFEGIVMKKSYLLLPLIAVIVIHLIQLSAGAPREWGIPFARGEPASQQWNVTWGGESSDSSYGVMPGDFHTLSCVP